MIAYLWVALGSALGGMARYGFALAAGRMWGDRFPWGTIAINVLGSFVIGFFGALTVAGGALPAGANLRVFVMVGICGGFTTFSSFSLQTFSLARDGSWVGAMGNVVLSVVLCLAAVTAGSVSAERLGGGRRQASVMAPGVLAILDRTETARPVLAAAALAAARFGDARVEVLHLRHEGLGDFMPTEDVMTRGRQAEIDGVAARKSDEMRSIFQDWRVGSGIGVWREIVGETASVVPAEAGGADLVVIGYPAGRDQGDGWAALHASLLTAGRATLLVPEVVPASLGQHVAVAWKPSAAAERAVAGVWRLLAGAEHVTVLIETQDGGAGVEPFARVADLRNAGVWVEVHRFAAAGRRTGDALVAEAHAVGADMLVMGAYSRGQVAEFVLGGATREVLAAADLPVVMRC